MSNTVREDQYTETKRSLSEWREAVESIAAFATAEGGTVHIGIGPDGLRAGVQIGKRTLEELADQIKRNTEPPQYPSITFEGGDETAVILVRIEQSPVKPVCAFGTPFRRVGRTNQRLTLEEAYRLREQTTGRTWDALSCSGLTPRDLSRAAVTDLLSRAGQSRRTATNTVLETLGLIHGHELRNAAALLFARNPQRFIPGSQVQCARFDGTTSVRFLDEQTLDGPVAPQIDAALRFVTRNTRQAIRITGRPERDIVPEYPTEAVREAVVNAVCHRDYAAAGTVQVRIYDDRLEIWNPGALPPGLTVEALYREHASLPRNRLLAQAFHRARLIEHWGTGTLRIIRECEEAGLPEPAFQSEMGVFIARFRPGGSAGPVPATPEDRLSRAAAHVRRHGPITTREYVQQFEVSRRQAQDDLRLLVQRGVLERVGFGRSAAYRPVALIAH